MQIEVVAHIHAKPGLEAQLAEVLEGFVEPTRREEGCLRYDLLVDLDQPGRFTFIEVWASREALDAHGRSAHIQAGRARFPELVGDAPWVQVLRRIR
jgi:quinol monooxygenase YgiN